MAGLMVYIPGSTSNDGEAELTRVGLGDLLDRNVAAIPLPIGNSGPDGGNGRLIIFDMGPGFPDTPHNVDWKTQGWKPAPPDPEKRTELAAGRYWLGYVKGGKPTPAELRRPDVIDGEYVTLRDGQQWVIPIEDYLPRRLTVSRHTGNEVREVADRHLEFSNWCNALFETFLSDGFAAMLQKDKVIVIDRGLSFAAMALSKNYRVTRDVVDLLELIEDYEAWEIAKVATGIAPALRLVADQKKTGSNFHSSDVSSMQTSTPADSNVQITSPHCST